MAYVSPNHRARTRPETSDLYHNARSTEDQSILNLVARFAPISPQIHSPLSSALCCPGWRRAELYGYFKRLPLLLAPSWVQLMRSTSRRQKREGERGCDSPSLADFLWGYQWLAVSLLGDPLHWAALSLGSDSYSHPFLIQTRGETVPHCSQPQGTGISLLVSPHPTGTSVKSPFIKPFTSYPI